MQNPNETKNDLQKTQQDSDEFHVKLNRLSSQLLKRVSLSDESPSSASRHGRTASAADSSKSEVKSVAEISETDKARSPLDLDNVDLEKLRITFVNSSFVGPGLVRRCFTTENRYHNLMQSPMSTPMVLQDRPPTPTTPSTPSTPLSPAPATPTCTNSTEQSAAVSHARTSSAPSIAPLRHVDASAPFQAHSSARIPESAVLVMASTAPALPSAAAASAKEKPALMLSGMGATAHSAGLPPLAPKPAAKPAPAAKSSVSKV